VILQILLAYLFGLLFLVLLAVDHECISLFAHHRYELVHDAARNACKVVLGFLAGESFVTQSVEYFQFTLRTKLVFKLNCLLLLPVTASKNV
jgi:hypothetical protein